MFGKKKKKQAEEILKDKNKVDELLRKVMYKLGNLPVIGGVFSDIPILVDMVKDYVNGAYREVPVASIIMIIIALMYFISPVDIIPDVVPFLGKLDDAAIISLVLVALHNDIADYKNFKY